MSDLDARATRSETDREEARQQLHRAISSLDELEGAGPERLTTQQRIDVAQARISAASEWRWIADDERPTR